MYRFCFAAVVLILNLAMFCAPSHAESDVLVPSDDDTSITGSAPSTDTSSPADESKDSTKTTSLPRLDPDEAPGAQEYTPVPPSMVKDGNAVAAMPGGPQVVQMPLPSSSDSDALPESLKINIAPKYRWGPSDTLAVNNTLGIPQAAVPQHCRLSATGLMHGTAAPGIFLFDFGLADNGLAHFDGKPLDVSLRLYALCDKVPLPANAHYIEQIGDKYKAMVASIDCPPPPHDGMRLTIEYAGNNKGKCVYR